MIIMASEVEVEAPEFILNQRHDGPFENPKQDEQGKNDVGVSKSNSDNTNGECFLCPPSVGMVVFEDGGRGSEDCPEKAADHDRAETTVLESSNQQNGTKKSDTVEEVKEEITGKPSLDAPGKETSKEEVIQSEAKKNGEDGYEKISPVETATSLVDSDRVLISKMTNDEKEGDISAPESSEFFEGKGCLKEVGQDNEVEKAENSSFEEKLENETRDEDKNSQCDMLNKEDTTEANVKDITGILDGDRSQNENDSSLGNDSVEKGDEINEPRSKIETIEDIEENAVSSEEKIHERQTSEVYKSRELMSSEGNADEEGPVKDIDTTTGEVEEKCAEPLESEPEKRQEGNNSEQLMETGMEAKKASESDLQSNRATSDEKQALKEDAPAEINVTQETATETITQSLPGSKSEVDESSQNDDVEPCTKENSKSGDFLIEKEGNVSTLLEEQTGEKNDVQDSTTTESIDNFDETDVRNLKQETNQNMAEDSAIEEKTEGVKDETEEKSAEKIEELERSTSTKNIALEQSNANQSLDETLDSSIQASVISPIEESAEMTSLVPEKIDDTTEQLKDEENIPIISTEVDGQVDHTTPLQDEEGKPSQASENEAVPTGNSEKNTKAPKEEESHSSIEISENPTVKSAEEAVDVTSQQNRDEENDFGKAASEESEVIREEPTETAKDDNACVSQSTEDADENAEKASSAEDVAAEETVQSNIEFSTPSTEAEEKETILEKEADHGDNASQSVLCEENSTNKTTVEAKTSSSDQEQEGAVHTSHAASTEENPGPIDVAEKEDAKPAEDLLSKGNNEGDKVPGEDSELDVEVSISKAEDADQEATEVDNKDSQTVKQEATVVDVQHIVKRATVNEEKMKSTDEDSSQQHDEKNATEPEIAAIQKDGNDYTPSEEPTHEENNIQDSAARELVNDIGETQNKDLQQETNQSTAEDSAIKETTEVVKCDTEEKTPEKIEELERSTSPESTGPEQSNVNLSLDETPEASIEESHVALTEENTPELRTSPAAEEIDDNPGQLKAEENSPVKSTEIDEQIEGNSGMNTGAPKEEVSQNSIEISEDRTISGAEEAVNAASKENTDNCHHFEKTESVESKENNDANPNATKDDSAAELTEESLTQSHQIIDEVEHVETEPMQPAKEDSTSCSQSTEPAEEDATKASSTKDAVAEEMNPGPIDAVEEQDGIPTENLISEGNNDDDSVPRADNELDVDDSTSTVEDAHQEAAEVENKETPTVKQEATEENVVERETVHEEKKTKSTGEDSSQQHDEKNATEPEIAEIQKDRNESILSKEDTHEDNDIEDLAARELVDDFGETEVRDLQQETHQNVAEEGPIEEKAEGVQDEAEEKLSPEKESKVSPIEENTTEVTSSPEAEKLDNPEQPKGEEISPVQSTEIGGQDDENSDMNIGAAKVEVSPNSIQISGDRAINSAEEAVDATSQENGDTSEGITEENHDASPNGTKEDSVAELPEESLTQCHQIIEESAEQVKTEPIESAKEESACHAQSTEPVKEEVTKTISTEDIAAAETVQSNVELTTPCTEAEEKEIILQKDADHIENSSQSNLSERSFMNKTAEVEPAPSDQEHEGAIHISHVSPVEKNPGPIDAVEELDAKPAEDLQGNNEDDSVPGDDNELDVEGPTSKTEDADQETLEVENKESQTVTEEATEEDSHHVVNREIVDDEKPESTDKDSSQQHSEKNATESQLPETQNDREEEAHVTDTVKDEEIVNCEFEQSNSANATGNEETIQASQSHDRKSIISNEEVELVGIQEETTIDKHLENAEDDDSNNSIDDISAEEEKFVDLNVNSPQQPDENVATESETIQVENDGEEPNESKTFPETQETDTVKDEETVNQNSNSNNARGDEETIEESPGQDEKADISNNVIQVIQVPEGAKIDEHSGKIEDENSSNIEEDVSIDKEEQNDNQVLSITGVDNQLEDEESMSKGEDANQEAKEQELNEETQSITKEATNEKLQQIADNEDKFADANVDSEQYDLSTTTEIDNSEVLKDVKTHEESGSDMIHGTETTRDKEFVEQQVREVNSGNEKENQESTEASPGQEDCTMVSDDGTQVTEVQEETTIGKSHEKIEDENTNNIIDNVSAEEAEDVDKVERCTNSEASIESIITSEEADKSATEETNKDVEHPESDALSAEHLQEESSKNEDSMNKDRNANQNPEPLDVVEKINSELVSYDNSLMSSEANKSGTEEIQNVEEQQAKLAEHLPSEGHKDSQGVGVTEADNELNDDSSIEKSEDVDQEATEGETVKETENIKQEATETENIKQEATEEDFQNETAGEIQDDKDQEEVHASESNKTCAINIVKEEEIVNQDSNSGKPIENKVTIEASSILDENANISNGGIQVIGVQEEAKIDKQHEKIEHGNSAEGVSIEENLKPAEDIEELECGTKLEAANDESITSDEANKSAEHVIQEEQTDNQILSVTEVDNQLEDEESMSKGEHANQEVEELKLDEKTPSVTKEATDKDYQQVADHEEIQVAEVLEEATIEAQHDSPQDEDPIKSTGSVSKEENHEKPECGSESTQLPEANTADDETTSRDANDLEASSTENMTESEYTEAKNFDTKGKEIDLAKCATEKDEEADRSVEKNQINEKSRDVDNAETTKEDPQRTTTEEVKPMDSNADLSQQENDRNASVLDGVQVHEDEKTNEKCNSGEMDGSDFDTQKETINQGSEADNPCNEVPNQQTSTGVEESEQAGEEKNVLNQDETPEISTDQAQVKEVIETEAIDTECRIREPEDPESIVGISAKEVKLAGTPITEDKTEPIEDEANDDLNEQQDASLPAMTKTEEETGSLEDHPEGSIVKTLDVRPAGETQEDDTKDVPQEMQILENSVAQETKTIGLHEPEYEAGDVASAENNANQSVGERELDDIQLESISNINYNAAEAIIIEEMPENHILQRNGVEDQLHQPSSKQLEMKNEDTCTIEDKEDSIMDVQIPKEKKSEDKSLEKATQKTESELEVSISDLELTEGSQLKQELVEEAEKMDESSITEPGDLSSGSHGCNAASESATQRDIDSFSPKIINENEVQLSNKSEQTGDVSLQDDSTSKGQEQSENSAHLLKLDGQESTKLEETDEENHQNTVNRELIPAENLGEINIEANDATICDTKREESLGQADPLKKLEDSSEIMVAGEKITELGESDMTNNEEANTEVEGHKTNSDECSMDKTKEVDQVVKELRINDTQHPAPLDNVFAEEVKYMNEPSSTDKIETASTEFNDSHISNTRDAQAEQAPTKVSGNTENNPSREPDFPEEDIIEEEKQVVACNDNMPNVENKILVEEELSSQETHPQGNDEKALDINSTVETDQPEGEKQFSPEVDEVAEKEAKETISIPQPEYESRDVALEDNSNQLPEKLHVNDAEREVAILNEIGSPMNCQDAEEVTAADIIASQISRAIEEEEQRQQQSCEQLNETHEAAELVTDKDDNISDNELLKAEDKNYASFEETTKQSYLPGEGERELELQKDWQPKQATQEKIERKDDVEMPEKKNLASVVQGADSPLDNGTNKLSRSSTEILNEKEIKDSNKLVSPQIDTITQLNSEENHANSCMATTDNNEQSASLEKVPEIPSEEWIKSEEIDQEKHHTTISSELIVDEKSLLSSEAHQTTMCAGATEQTAKQMGIQGDIQGSADQQMIARIMGEDEKQMMTAKRTEILDEKVQSSHKETKSPDKTEETIREDEEERTMESSDSIVSSQKEAAVQGKVSSLDIPKTQATILVPKTPEASDERKAKILADDSDSPTEPKNPENAITVTDGFILEKCTINTNKKPCQLSMENQQTTAEGLQEGRVRLQDGQHKETLEIQQMENVKKLENTNMPCKLVDDTMNASLNKIQPEDTTVGASKEINQIGSCPSQVSSTIESNGNKVVALQQQEPLKESLQIEESSTGKDEITETKARSVPMDLGSITAQKCQTGSHMREMGEQTILKEETADRKEATDEEQKTDEEKDESIDQTQEDLEREIPITAEAVREMELKATQKKSHNILSGVGSKVKHSISKMKKAIACSSAQFSQEDVIIKLNKNKKV